MRPALGPVLTAALAAALAGCSGAPDETSEASPKATQIPKSVADSSVNAKPVESDYGTPVKDRSAVIGLLNKRNNLTQDLVLKTGESRRVGNVIVKLATCERTLPWERPEEEGAFVQVFVEQRPSGGGNLQWQRVFSGWLFRNSPSLNVVEHPVYDVWIKSCAMKFPGEEDSPQASASTSSAAKAAGSASGTTGSGAEPAPAAKPSPTASPAPQD